MYKCLSEITDDQINLYSKLFGRACDDVLTLKWLIVKTKSREMINNRRS